MGSGTRRDRGRPRDGGRTAWLARPLVRGLALSALVVLAALLAGGCASLASERNLAPFFSEHSLPGGGTETEAFGGALRLRRTRPGGLMTQWALRPIVIHDFEPAGDSISRFLTPLGISERRGGEYTWQLLPVTRFNRRELGNDEVEWTLFTLPGIYWSRLRDGRIVRAWFPFGGVFEDFLSFDELVFVVWPVFMRSERAGRITYHFLFPVFAYTYGHGGKSGRVWPLYGRSKVEGSYDRVFVLWPIFHRQHNFLSLPPEKQERKWMVFPFVGRTERGTFRATTLLWPFFGWSRDPATGFWAFDGPWPFVRLLRDPAEDRSRSRFWPLYSRYHGDGLDSRWFLWPFVNVRREVYDKAEKDSVYVVPFWQRWVRNDEVTGRSTFEKLWPLYQVERTGDRASKLAFPALNPLWRTPEVDEMYAWIYELYTREKSQSFVRERAWLGLYRRERDEAEDRRAVSFLWALREYRDAAGVEIDETSLFFGLLRWRKRGSDSLEWLPPALPGPGWPLVRAAPAPRPDATPVPGG